MQRGETACGGKSVLYTESPSGAEGVCSARDGQACLPQVQIEQMQVAAGSPHMGSTQMPRPLGETERGRGLVGRCGVDAIVREKS